MDFWVWPLGTDGIYFNLQHCPCPPLSWYSAYYCRRHPFWPYRRNHLYCYWRNYWGICCISHSKVYGKGAGYKIINTWQAEHTGQRGRKTRVEDSCLYKVNPNISLQLFKLCIWSHHYKVYPLCAGIFHIYAAFYCCLC